MHKLFSLSFRRIANRLNQQQLNALNVGQALQTNKIPPTREGFLYRLPREELKHVANIPCPINNLQQTTSQTIIASSKAIRHHVKLSQEKICAKCPFKDACQSAKLPFTGTIDNAPKDVLVFWSGLSALYKPESVYFRQWVSAYKLGDSIIAALNDLSEDGKEIEQYEKLRVFKSQEHEEIMAKKSLKAQSKEGQISLPNSIDQKFKLIQKLTEDHTLKTSQEGHQDLSKASTPKKAKDFSFDDVQQFEPKVKIAKNTYKESKQLQSQKSLKNSIGYQSIQKRQETTEKAYQKPKPKKIERGQYQQIIKQIDFEAKNPKIKEKKQSINAQQYRNQRQSKFQNKKSNEAKPKYYNQQSQNLSERKFNSQPKTQSYREKTGQYDRNYNKKADFRQTQRNFNDRQYEERRPSKNYQKYQDKKSQKYSSNKQTKQSRNYYNQEKPNKQNVSQNKWNSNEAVRQKDSFKQFSKPIPKQQDFQQFDTKKQVKQKSAYQPAPKTTQSQNAQQSVETQSRFGRNIRRRSRSSTNVQSE